MREADKEGKGLTEEIGMNFTHFSKSIVIENLHVYVYYYFLNEGAIIITIETLTYPLQTITPSNRRT